MPDPVVTVQDRRIEIGGWTEPKQFQQWVVPAPAIYYTGTFYSLEAIGPHEVIQIQWMSVGTIGPDPRTIEDADEAMRHDWEEEHQH